MPAECELRDEESLCGVLAAGRCAEYRRAFCESHTNATYWTRYSGGGIPQVPRTEYSRTQCTECGIRESAARKAAERAEKEAEKEAGEERRAALERRFQHVLSALNAADCPGIGPTRVVVRHRPGRFRWSKPTPVFEDRPRAYPVGTYSWSYTYVSPDPGPMESRSEFETGVTPDGKIIPLGSDRSFVGAGGGLWHGFPGQRIVEALERIAAEHGVSISE